MGSNFFSPPSKRPLISDSTAASSNGKPSYAAKRAKPPQKSPSSLTAPQGHVAFRLLCHSSRVGGLIGKSGSVIKQLQVETSSKIRIEDSLSGSDDRVVVIIAATSPIKKIILRSAVSENFGEEYEVSPAQEAVIRVYEKILNVTAEMDKVPVTALGAEVVSCRLLVETVQASFVIGKGGKMVEKMRKESGSKIRVLMGDKLPTGVAEGDEVVEIDGDMLAVKKALIAVSRRIQDCPAADKSKLVDSKPLGSAPQSTVPDLYDDVIPHRTSLLPTATTSSFSHALGSHRLSYGDDRVPAPETILHRTSLLPPTTTSSISHVLGGHRFSFGDDRIPAPETVSQQQTVVFKLLCSADKVGGIIGRGGSVIKALQDDTGVTISIGPAVADCEERLVTITSVESPESRYPSAQRALVLTFTRYMESIMEKGLEKGSGDGSSVCARLLVPLNQAGCLIGKGGVIISEMRKATRAGIRMIRDKLPKCASEDDEVVEISGEFVNVQDAVHQVAGRLLDNQFANATPAVVGSKSTYSSIYETNPYERLRDPVPIGLHRSQSLNQDSNISSPSVYERSLYERTRDPEPVGLHRSFSTSQSLGRNASLLQGMDPPGLSHRADHSSSPVLLRSQVGVTPSNYTDISRSFTSSTGGLELGGGSRPAFITNTTVEILVPDNAIGSVYGENGSNLARIRQISRAKVVVNEARPGTRDRTVTISGTPDETQAAQSLLHAFILTGRS